jgi:hypothetical protein
MVDGSVQTLSITTDIGVLTNLALRDDGNIVTLDQ